MSGEGSITGVVHFHSCYSPDSVTSVASVLSVARRENLDFALLTDHDTINGSLALGRKAEERGMELIVPVAAEYRTDLGDVIAAFIKHEVQARGFADLARDVRDQGGLLMLPHPYIGHSRVDLLASEVDIIEVFNGHASEADNERARLLAREYDKPFYFGSDAHLASGIARVVISVENKGDLATSLLSGRIEPLRCLPVGRRDLQISRLIRAAKTRDLRPVFDALRRRALRLYRGHAVSEGDTRCED